MQETEGHETPSHGVDYERRDVSIRWLVIFGVGLTLMTIGSLWLMKVLFDRFEMREVDAAGTVIPATRVAVENPRRPPEPILQGAPGSRFELRDPKLEMDALNAELDAVLTSSGWVDRDAGVARIPIEHAKRLLLERGLPTRETPAPDRAGGGDAP